MKPARILVVEDEVIVSLDIRDRLTLLGYEISGVFSRGEDVLAELENHRPDLVLMDIRLKGALDGIAVADQVRQRWRLPVVYLTAYAEDTTLQRAKVTEPFGYIVKPFEDREIKSVIEMALYKHQAEERLRQSERRYATTLRSIGDGVIATDPEGRVTFMNRVAETLTGWSIAQAQGRPLGEIFRIISESNRQPVEDAIARALREKAVVSLPSHTILIDREGHETPIDDGAAPILDDEGAVTGAVLVFQDVSSHRQQERSLRQSEAQFRLVWESSIDGLRLLDHRGIMLRVNQAFCELTGKSREELEGQSLATIYEAEQGKHALEQYLNRYANKTLDRYVERKLRLWNGKEVWFAVTNSLLNPDGDQPAILSVFRDVTERKLVEESLRMRVLALTQPLDDPSSFQFSDLFNIQDIQRIQDAFANATGVASIITHPDGTPITRPSNFCRLCNEVIRKTPKGLANCYKSDAVLGSYNPSGPVVQTCLSGGLWDAGASISVGGKHVANWLIGQVRNEAQDDIQMLKYADEIGADREQFQQALAEVPVMSREQFIKVAQALFCFANELSLKAFQNAQQARFIADRQRAAEALEVSEARFRKLLESTPNVAVQGFGPEGLVTYWNQASTTLYGYTAEEALDKNLLDLVVPNEIRNAVLSVIRSMAETGESHPPVEWLLRRKNGSQVPVFTSYVVLRAAASPAQLFCLAIDLTERKKAEEQRLEMDRRLLHAQKLESLGVLAGGIAHDFNNLLTAILGNIEVALMDTSELSPARLSLSEASQATRRAADLTRQMLAYSGRGKFNIRDLDLTELVEEMAQLLKVSISKNATLHLQVNRSLPRIHADAAQVQQIVMNLITNASEAIGDQIGSITLATGVRDCDEAFLAKSRLTEKAAPGHYVFLEVSDTGCGMDESVQQRLFDPFFTTKFTGRGLGLSAVLGAVRGHKGCILVSSVVGRGTTIQVLFPANITETACPESSNHQPGASPSPLPAQASGTVLIVDDEEPVRMLAARILSRQGLQVLCAADGEEAIAIFQKKSREISCVILDLTMPKMDGMRAYSELRRIRPEIRVLLASGFDEHELNERFAGYGLAGFIQKPYEVAKLIQQVSRLCSPSPNA